MIDYKKMTSTSSCESILIIRVTLNIGIIGADLGESVIKWDVVDVEIY